MKLGVSSPSDLLSGLFFLAVGGGAVWMAWFAYPLGTLQRMGPGMLPLMIGVLLTLVGAGLVVRSLVVDQDEEGGVRLPDLATYRAAFFVLLALLAFALLIRQAGLFLSTVVLVLISSRAEPGYSLVSAAILSVVMAALSVAIFVYGIGLPLRIWPRF